MNIALGSVCQRLQGRMPLQLFLTFVLCSLLLPDTTSALFYTNSKEHDYPRIGRRSGKDMAADILSDSVEEDAYIHPPSARRPFEGKSLPLADVAFKTWDINGDGFLSRNEFWPKFNRRLRRRL